MADNFLIEIKAYFYFFKMYSISYILLRNTIIKFLDYCKSKGKEGQCIVLCFEYSVCGDYIYSENQRGTKVSLEKYFSVKYQK